MIFKDFEAIIEKLPDTSPKVLAVAVAEDIDVLKAVQQATEQGMIRSLLFGDRSKITELAEKIGFDPGPDAIFDEKDHSRACRLAVQAVSEGRADFLMKGNVKTALLMKTFISREFNLRTDKWISHISVIDIEKLDRLVILTDNGMNILPDLYQKIEIIQNAVEFMHNIGISQPRVALLSAIETINPDMPSTLEAAILTKMNQRGQIRGCIVDGPLALDNAINLDSARRKNIDSPVAGKADILVVPNIETGNSTYKALAYFTSIRAAHLIVGTRVPIVVPSRTDNDLIKFLSIAVARMSLQ